MDRPRNTEETRIMSEPRFRGNRLAHARRGDRAPARGCALDGAQERHRGDPGRPALMRCTTWPLLEFMQCYVEINTGVCRTVDAVEADLAPKVRAVERVADRHGVRLVWAATHPFSRWRDQQITPDDRYYRLAALLQETVVRPVTFGVQVQVGVVSGDKAILDRLQDPAVSADRAGDVGQQPVLARAGDRASVAPGRRAGRLPDRGHDAGPGVRGRIPGPAGSDEGGALRRLASRAWWDGPCRGGEWDDRGARVRHAGATWPIRWA